MKKCFILLIIFVIITGFLSEKAAAWLLYPLDIEDASTTSKGALEARLGGGYYEDINLAFDAGETDRDIAVIPSLDLRLGAGDIVELGAYIDGLYNDEAGIDNSYGVGDLRLLTKLALRKEDDYPAWALNFEVKLPNASNEDRLGTDEFDFYSALLMSKKFDRIDWHFNLGIGILGDPYQNSSQDDVMTYGAGLIAALTDRLDIALGVSGQAFSNDNNDFSQVTGGFRFNQGSCTWDIGASAGLTDESQDWSVVLGLSKSFDDFLSFNR